jgi:hypothetical protein
VDLASETLRVLQHFKNAVLEGPPGTGKTFVVEQVAEAWEGKTGRKLGGAGTGTYAITLHPSTTYEEFVDGLRFDEGEDRFVRKPGFLLRVVKEAQEHPGLDYLVLLDEINRANVPKVLGDVLLCMEASKRTVHNGTSWTGGIQVTLPYSGDLLSIPSNVYLLGTMNSSDRSIAPLDSALRRRFGFVRAEPIMGDALRQAIEAAEGDESRDRVTRSIDELTNLNEILRECLGPESLLGHSYLFGLRSTTGTPTATNDPLGPVRYLATHQSSTRAFWLEVGGMWGGNENQVDVPDQTTSRRGLVPEFYPMTSNGQTTGTRSAPGAQDFFDIHWSGASLLGNTIEYNNGGSNVRVKFQGRTAGGDGLGSFTHTGGLTQKIHVWLARPDDTFDFVTLDRTDTSREAIEGVSDWHERTAGANGRSYGAIDLARLISTGTVPHRSEDEEPVWLTWRYAILPQLVDTLTQLGATDLFDPTVRNEWVKVNANSGVDDRLKQFDSFLSSMSLSLREEGYGLSRALVIKEAPVGADHTVTTAHKDQEDGEAEAATYPNQVEPNSDIEDEDGQTKDA